MRAESLTTEPSTAPSVKVPEEFFVKLSANNGYSNKLRATKFAKNGNPVAPLKFRNNEKEIQAYGHLFQRTINEESWAPIFHSSYLWRKRSCFRPNLDIEGIWLGHSQTIGSRSITKGLIGESEVRDLDGLPCNKSRRSYDTKSDASEVTDNAVDHWSGTYKCHRNSEQRSVLCCHEMTQRLYCCRWEDKEEPFYMRPSNMRKKSAINLLRLCLVQLESLSLQLWWPYNMFCM